MSELVMDRPAAATADTETSPSEPRGWSRVLVSVCSLLFGVSAWVSVNGLWVQMPLLVPVLPEGWNLGSVLVIVIQVANVGPLAYTLARNHLGVPDKKGLRYGAAENRGYEPDNEVATATSENSGAGVRRSSGESSSLSRQGRLKRCQWWLVLALQAVIACLGNGVLLAIQTYSSLPYGQLAHHLATNLAVIANPVSCAVAARLSLKSLGGLAFITAGGLGCAAYILLLAVQSPNPVLAGTVAGASIMVLAWVLFVSLTTFVKCRLAAGTMAHGGARSLLWYGVATQGGSFVGALVMFVLTNYTHTFKSS